MDDSPAAIHTLECCMLHLQLKKKKINIHLSYVLMDTITSDIWLGVVATVCTQLNVGPLSNFATTPNNT